LQSFSERSADPMAESIITQPSTDGHTSDVQVAQARKLFDQGRKACATESHRFAIHAFADAIRHDPSQRQYAKELLAALSSAVIVGPGTLATAWRAWQLKRKLTAAIAAGDWHAAVEHGTKLLSLRPTNTAALLGLGQACAALKYFDSALVYFRHAHKLRPNDVLINRQCGRVLGKVGQFDEAVGCWQWVQKRLPHDEEAVRAIGDLAVRKLF
jgi:Flp pilus assembly protein TadD